MKLNAILCPIDFSPSSAAALKYASSLAAESHSLLYILHVEDGLVGFMPGLGGYGYVPELEDSHTKEQRERLQSITPTKSGVSFQHRYLTGDPEKEIIDFADREDVDLIVMGSHGRTGLSRVLMGSIAEGVVRRAQCPVLTVKQPMHRQEQVPDRQEQSVERSHSETQTN